jgi:GTP-binding protein YchF
MGFSCGIVGLPNVGKSTLFNALTSTIAAEAANYPFCTIEPNKGIVAVPDKRLDLLANMASSKKMIPTQLEIVDIAGLVKGASKGEGLGNQFLANIRESDAIIHVLRCFEDGNITHVEGGVDPVRDLEIITTELILSDLESVEKRLPNIEKKLKSGKKELQAEFDLLSKLYKILAEGRMASEVLSQGVEANELRLLNLITSKPAVYVCNVAEEEVKTGNIHTKKLGEYLGKSINMIYISAKIEEEISQLSSPEEKKEFLDTLGLEETGLDLIIRQGYNILDLITFFTVGEKEAHAWTVKKGAKAPAAAGVIHTDFEKGFIRAEVIAYNDFVAFNGESGAKDNGKMRLEGKEYIVSDGDIVHFRFNV